MRPTARIALFSLMCGVSALALAQRGTTLTIRTPSGPVQATETTVEPEPQGVAPAADRELRSIRSLSLRAGAFVAAYVPGATRPTLRQADEAFRRWQQEKKPRYTEQQVIEMLGAWLGEQLVADLQMEWVIVTDQHGRDYGVRAKQQEAIAFPFASVEKRVEDKAHGFIEAVYYTVRQTITGEEAKGR